jgi:hypothetical protein
VIVAARISHRDVRRQNEQEGCGSDRPDPSFLTTALEEDPSSLTRGRGTNPTKQDLFGKSIVMSWPLPLFLESCQVVWSFGRGEGIPLCRCNYDVDGEWTTSYDMQQHSSIIKKRRRSQTVRISSAICDEKARMEVREISTRSLSTANS